MSCPIAQEHGQEPVPQKPRGSKRRFIQLSPSPPGIHGNNPELGMIDLWNLSSAALLTFLGLSFLSC